MKTTFFSIAFIVSFNLLLADIAPNPIAINGIYTVDDCKIQMTSEYVFANLYNDSAKVECTFELKNFSDATQIQIGFPVMNFEYWSIDEYNPADKASFKIYIDGRLLTDNDIKVPNEMDGNYKKYMSAYFFDKVYQRKRDSIYDVNGVKERRNRTIYPAGVFERTKQAMKELHDWRQSKPKIDSELWKEFGEQKEKGNFPWYVWDVEFNQQENRQVKVVYSLPSGLGYGSNFRYFKYILETGSGWYKTIEKAVIKLKFHNIKLKNIEETFPNNYIVDARKRTIQWTFIDLEPTAKDDIYVRYFNARERRQWERYRRKKTRNQRAKNLNPRN